MECCTSFILSHFHFVCEYCRRVGGANPRLQAVKCTWDLWDLVKYQRCRSWGGCWIGIGIVSVVLTFLSFVTKFLFLFPLASFSTDLLIGVAVMSYVTIGQLRGNVSLGILGGLKTLLGLVAEISIPPCFSGHNRLGSGSSCKLSPLLVLFTPSGLRSLDIQVHVLFCTNFWP